MSLYSALTRIVTRLSVLLALGAAAASPPDIVHSPAAARSELSELYQQLQAAHFDLYAHRPRAEYEDYLQTLRRSFKRPLSHLELQRELQKFMAYGQVAHARIEFPALEFERYREAGGTVLPLQLRVRDGRAYVVGDQRGAADRAADQVDTIAPGTELLRLNGISMAKLRTRLLAHVSADNDYLADTLLELRLAALLWLELGEVEVFDLQLRNPQQGRAKVRINARTRAQMRASESVASSTLLALDWNKREARMLDGKLAYLRPGPFFNNDEGAADMWDPSSFAAFIDRSFDQFAAAKAKVLLIDLRDNPGGDNSFSDLLVRRYADQAFRFASSFRIKVSAATVQSNAQRLKPGETGVGAQLAASYAGKAPGTIVDFPIAMVEPAPLEQRFAGKVYLLVNRYSYSNAVMLAAMSQDYRFATIIGEETSDLASTYGAMEQFTLKHSKIVVGYPKAQIIRPSKDPSSRGVVPDIAIATPLLEGLEDPVLMEAIRRVQGE